MIFSFLPSSLPPISGALESIWCEVFKSLETSVPLLLADGTWGVSPVITGPAFTAAGST